MITMGQRLARLPKDIVAMEIVRQGNEPCMQDIDLLGVAGSYDPTEIEIKVMSSGLGEFSELVRTHMRMKNYKAVNYAVIEYYGNRVPEGKTWYSVRYRS
jgi:hypothetical protein